MSLEHLRNVTTGEVRDVETGTDEYFDLINEVYDHDGSARPKWEITGHHHTRRMDSGDVRETDIGEKYKPVPGSAVTAEDLGPEAHPERVLTEAEVGAGLKDWKQKSEQLGLSPADAGVEKLERVKEEERIDQGLQAAGRSSSSSGRKKSDSSSPSSSGATPTGGGKNAG